MTDNFRRFQAADPSGRVWDVDFLWQQNAISIRNGDAVDVKFALSSGAERREIVVTLPHPALLEASREAGRPVTDAWCSRLAAQHLKRSIERGGIDPGATSSSWEADRASTLAESPHQRV
jgi:hypothetical protein